MPFYPVKNKKVLLRDSLSEALVVIEYCLTHKKDPLESGYYGFPAALLLLTIIDSLGANVQGIPKKRHFEILNHEIYGGLHLSHESINIIHKKYRCILSHELALEEGFMLRMGEEWEAPFDILPDKTKAALNLRSLLKCTQKAVNEFFLIKS